MCPREWHPREVSALVGKEALIDFLHFHQGDSMGLGEVSSLSTLATLTPCQLPATAFSSSRDGLVPATDEFVPVDAM